MPCARQARVAESRPAGKEQRGRQGWALAHLQAVSGLDIDAALAHDEAFALWVRRCEWSWPWTDLSVLSEAER